MDRMLDSIIKREKQLNAIAYIIIVTLIAIAGSLVAALVASVPSSSLWPIGNEFFRTLFPGLLLMLVLYLADQHQRTRRHLLATYEELERTRRELQGSVDRLSFAHESATAMGSLTTANGLTRVLVSAVEHFNADAAALVTDDVHIETKEGVDHAEPTLACMQAAVTAVREGHPQLVQGIDGRIHTIAVPMRVDGRLESVLCVWRKRDSFAESDLEGLSLVAEIVATSLENHALLERTRTQLQGTLMTLVELAGRRQHGYSERASAVADLAVNVGVALGLTRAELTELRIAAMLHDVGMLDVPEEIIDAPRELTIEELMVVRGHTEAGARIARMAQFSPAIQEAILCHHERLDGTGYPRGLRGDALPLFARIIAACDAYQAMISPRPHRPALTPARAMAELRSQAGTGYDPQVVSAIAAVTGQRTEDPARAELFSSMLEQVS